MIFGWPMLSAPSGQFVTSTFTISGIGPLDVFGSAQMNGLDILDWGSGWIVYTGYNNANGFNDLTIGQGFSGGSPVFIGLGVTSITVSLTCSAGGSPTIMQGTIIITEPPA